LYINPRLNWYLGTLGMTSPVKPRVEFALNAAALAD
jgi:hypothetical protein